MTISDLASAVTASLHALNDPSARDPLAASRWMGLHAPDVVTHGFGDEPLRGRDRLIDAYQAFYDAFPDLQLTIEDALACGDRDVVTRTTWRGTHQGPYAEVPASGRTIDGVQSIAIYRFRDGSIVERWSIIDQLAMLECIGR